MKALITAALSVMCLNVVAQVKGEYVQYNKLTEVEGTPYVIANSYMSGKMKATFSGLLFINTQTGERQVVNFAEGASLGKIEQVYNDSIGLNVLLVSARTADVNGKNGIDWEDPQQLLVLSPDGKTMVKLTEDTFFPTTWLIIRKSGRLVVSGHTDSNGNGKQDEKDENRILVYDLVAKKRISYE